MPLVIILLYYNYYEESGDQWSAQCTFYRATGLLCPGCGGQRSFHALLHGHIVESLRNNLLVILLFPSLVYLYYILARIYILQDKTKMNRLNIPVWTAYLFIGILVLYAILRNIPVSPFIYLTPPV